MKQKLKAKVKELIDKIIRQQEKMKYEFSKPKKSSGGKNETIKFIKSKSKGIWRRQTANTIKSKEEKK